MKTGILNVIVASFCITLAVGTANAAKFDATSPPSNEVAQRLQEAPKPAFVANMTAEEQAEEWLNNKKIQQGWDFAKERYVALGIGGFDSEEPRVRVEWCASQGAFSPASRSCSRCSRISLYSRIIICNSSSVSDAPSFVFSVRKRRGRLSVAASSPSRRL